MTKIVPTAYDENVAAFQRGYSAFFKGERVSYVPTHKEADALDRRANLLSAGLNRAADKIADSFTEQGVFVVDIHDTAGTYEETILEKTGVASNPYPLKTFAAKEWERGFNAAYFKNISYHATKKGKPKNATSRDARNPKTANRGPGKRPHYAPARGKPARTA